MRLNSTGTLWTDGKEYYSYRQQMTASYKGRKLFDSGRWSNTTAKHQSYIKNYCLGNYIELKYADFNCGIEYSIKKEIQNLTYELEERLTKRKTSKNLLTIDKLQDKITMLNNLLDE